jgi:glycosidase
MQWDDSPNAGFTTGEPWLPVHPDFQRRNVKGQKEDPHSVFNYYRKVLRLRRTISTLRRGSFLPLQANPKKGLAYLRSDSEGSVLVGLNFHQSPVKLHFDIDLHHSSWRVLLSTHPQHPLPVTKNSIDLNPFEAVILLAD